ncbi:hypothetical protein FCM35_KLT17696 [Carex littledalei]|uniref:Aminopeptidase n=1 Tax=Carex littledalei TaxID=544730 RepID=A0A833VY23_9POAL|nr:hypothetical protein FCM35_KLT17696 [Carex littledalei]
MDVNDKILPPTRKAIRSVKQSIAKRRIVEEFDLLRKRKVEEFDLLKKRKVEEFEGLIGRNTLIREAVQIVKESVIPVSKSRIVQELRGLIENEADGSEFLKLCKRVEYVIRASYLIHFENMMELYSLFDPVHGASKIKEMNLSPEQVDELEQKFLSYFFEVMKQSNFAIVTDEELEVAQSGNYLLNLPIVVDESKVDHAFLSKYFKKNPSKNLPEFSDKYLIFRRATGIDTTTDFFYMAKLDIIISRSWSWFLRKIKLEGISRLFHSRKSPARSTSDLKKTEETYEEYLTVERIRLESIDISWRNLLGKVEIQEPTFDRMIVVYRKASTDSEKDGGIYIKHYKNIPMADMELVLPEKKNPSLTPMDWVQFFVSVVVGLVALFTSLETSSNGLWVAIAIISALVGYCAKIYFSFQRNLETYQNLITQSMYDKQLDSGKGTLLHLCDDVIQQEVKEVIVSYFVLLKQGKATISELDDRCEELLKEKFGLQCNFDEEDAIQKLDKLGIVTKDAMDRMTCLPLQEANEKIGATTEELFKER